MNELLEKLTPTDTNFPVYSPIQVLGALRGVVAYITRERTISLEPNDYELGIHDADSQILRIIRMHLNEL